MKRLYMCSVAVAVIAASARAFDNDACETVVVKGEDGSPLRVNKSDYDADQADGGEGKFKLYKRDTEEAREAASEPPVVGQQVTSPPGTIVPPAPSAPAFVDPVPPASPSPGQYLIMPPAKGAKGGKFIVYGTDGKPVTGNPGIDEAGYDTKELAEDAINKVAGERPSVPSPAVAP